MRYGSVCSGIESASVAWHPLGWTPVFFAEIEKFPSTVLAHHWPNVPNLGDFTKIRDHEPIDLLVGGTPCQSFSVAGLRGGLDDPRGNLALAFLGLADRARPRWIVWENVPGVLSSNGGRDFGAILGGMVELGYGFAYRVLDAQHFGVPQRRRRVFVVGYLGDWRRAAAVLFERHSLSGNPPPRREAGKGLATGVIKGAAIGRKPEAGALNAHGGPHGRIDAESETFVAHSLRADGFDASEDGTGRGTPVISVCLGSDPIYGHDIAMPQTARNGDPGVIAFSAKDHGADAGDTSPTLRAGGHANSHANAGVMPAVAFAENSRAELVESDAIGLKCGGGKPGQSYPAIRHAMSVRRLTPRECERLQGFPDDYTLVPLRNDKGMPNGKWAKDGPRYKALGNSKAVPVVRWIGRRIEMVDRL